jgi:hypothetical protein
MNLTWSMVEWRAFTSHYIIKIVYPSKLSALYRSQIDRPRSDQNSVHALDYRIYNRGPIGELKITITGLGFGARVGLGLGSVIGSL